MHNQVPSGMSRRHFMKHLAGASAMAGTSMCFTNSMALAAEQLKKQNKAAILMWMGGGPSTMDIWDLKPGAPTGGEFKPIATKGDFQICEHMPKMAAVGDKFNIVRSMSTREADHQRGRYYMHTGYVPNPNMTHPSYGAVLAHELADKDLAIPPFISVGGGSEGPGFLGMSYAPLVVGSNGDVRNLKSNVEMERTMERMKMLSTIEKGFIAQNRGDTAKDHAKILDKTLSLMTSEQMNAFKVAQEKPEVLERYGNSPFGRGLLMARRLVETGVSFVEVDYGGWDNHANIFTTLKDQKLPLIDQAMAALIGDLSDRSMLKDVVVIGLVSLAMSFVATLYPSWRASRVNPAEALRYE